MPVGRQGPLAEISTAKWIEMIVRAAENDPTDLDQMLLCWTDWRRRSAETELTSARSRFDSVNFVRPERFTDRAITPPDWYRDAYTAAQSLQRVGEAGKCSVYVVALRGFGQALPHDLGLYVGSTCVTPEERFRKHLDGVPFQAVTCVTNCGVALLPSLSSHLKEMSRDNAERLERQLAIKLKAVLKRAGVPEQQIQGGH